MRRMATVRTTVSFLLAGFFLTCPGPPNISGDLWAQQAPKVQTFSGKIVSQNDVRLVLRDDDNNAWYHLDDQEKARQFFGKDVLITGTFDGLSGTIRVQSIVEGEPPAKPPANTEDMKQNSGPAKGGTAPPASTDTATPGVRQAHPIQPPAINVPTPRPDAVRSENEAMNHPQGEVSTSPAEAASTFLLTLPEEAVSASSSIAISSRRLVPMPPGVNRQMQPAKNLVVGRLRRRVVPSYPPDALQQRIDGTVRLRAAIGEDGKVQSVEPVSGPPLLVGAAVIAVHEWRYGPTIFDGRHIQTQADISLVFRLPY
ncbi:MAG: energy transducer TonB [Candidatus Acidiferrales bacterium]